MAQNDLNATRQYLVREGIGHPDALKSSHEHVLDSLQPAAIAELSKFDLPEIETDAVSPEDELRDAVLTRPAGDVASVRSILSLQPAAPQQDSLVPGKHLEVVQRCQANLRAVQTSLRGSCRCMGKTS